ncbi:MAG: ExbD/TolR family protein [Elainellaceae cyanobacterium]
MKTNWDAATEDVRIEILPLIDVIFCILTFFILAAVGLTRQSAINVDLPSAETGTAQMREMLIVSVDPIGQLYLEQQPVSSNQLTQALVNYNQTSPDGLIVLYASRSARYDDVVDVLDLLRSVGGNRVALATLPEGSDPAEIDPDQPGFDFDLDESLTDPFGGSDLSDPFNFDTTPGEVDPLNPDSDLPTAPDQKPEDTDTSLTPKPEAKPDTAGGG